MSLRSRPYDTFLGKPLTDARIHAYALLGKYGEVAKLRAEKRDLLASIRNKRTRSKPERNTQVTPDLNSLASL